MATAFPKRPLDCKVATKVLITMPEPQNPEMREFLDTQVNNKYSYS